MALGAPAELIAAVAANSEPEDFEVLEENWVAVNLFLRLSSQWNYLQGAVVGLNYSSVEWFFRLFKVEDPEAVFSDLQIMEFEALRILNAKD